MKQRLLILVLFGASLFAKPAAAKAATADAPLARTVPGAEKVAQTLSMITGVAISPLMGVGAVGAYQYFHAQTPEEKTKLPWFAQPLFWAPALLLVAACFVKDTAGTLLPTVVKKPFDVAETVEHKISGLVATGASLSGMGFAAIDLHWLYNGIMVPVAMAAFVVVFLASNAINILILLSPFTTVDAALKSFRLFILSTVAVSAWANPWIGAGWALIVIAFCWLISGWSFRLSHFGLVFVWEFITRRCNRYTPDKTVNRMFLGRKINKAPARTYGKLTRDDKGNLVLNYRPWLVLPERTLVLPEGKYAVGKGLFFSEIDKLEGDSARIALLLPPRYRSHEEELVKIYGLTDVRAIGLRAAWQWFKSLFGGGVKTVSAS